ncbi:MAG: [FeFe] hydrogenase H-cluster maturation GTPase HydF [Clostridiales bacterium]|nr:[FeFe] hydrogenase H-cluster maturation GTPase HydF [Clostridiales bacterium]MDY3746845.1 [FeFe] hydrogenase H-cluster maturation GTPase HydF [Lachnospiraceae bacterium]
MSLNAVPSANRVHIGFFGRRNAGKSSVVNAVTGQELSVVSDVRGTTTDPVLKSMELLPVGPVVIIDTPGFDDEGHLGTLRVQKTKQVLNKSDVAVLVVDASEGISEIEKELLKLFKEKDIPYVIAMNKADLLSQDDFENETDSLTKETDANEKIQNENDLEKVIYVSALNKTNIYELKERIAKAAVTEVSDKKIVGDLIKPSDWVVLVVPIDSAAPKGRLILPQQQTIRDILDADAVSIVVKENELKKTLDTLSKKPAMVITDSQAFEQVSKDTPEDILLTSFSILMARHKGFLEEAVKGVTAIDSLKDGDKVLICEGCTHHRQCDDIGTVKLPGWLLKYTGKNLQFEFTSGTGFPDDLSPYSLIIHCGACMLGEREVKYRMKCSIDQNIPFTNYGITIAFLKGILKRSLSVFPDLCNQIK